MDGRDVSQRSGQPDGRRPSGPGRCAGLVDSGHEDAVGRNPDHEQAIIVGTTAIEIEATLLDGDDPLARQSMDGRLRAPIEPHQVCRGEASRSVQILVYPEPVHPVVALGQDKHAVVRVSAAIEVVAAAIHRHGIGVSTSAEVGERQRATGSEHGDRRRGQVPAEIRAATPAGLVAAAEPAQQLGAKRGPRAKANRPQLAIEVPEIIRHFRHRTSTLRSRPSARQSLVLVAAALRPRISPASAIESSLP